MTKKNYTLNDLPQVATTMQEKSSTTMLRTLKSEMGTTMTKVRNFMINITLNSSIHTTMKGVTPPINLKNLNHLRYLYIYLNSNKDFNTSQKIVKHTHVNYRPII